MDTLLHIESLPLWGNYLLANPLWLGLFLFFPLIIWMRQRRPVRVLVVPHAAAWHRPSLVRSSPVALALAGLGLAALIIALARPQAIEDKREVRSQGYDIMLAIDISGSMAAEDYERDGSPINRLQAIKPIIQAFIEKRTEDRIGMVIFAGRAYTLSPLTFDHAWLARQTSRLRLGMIEDGTAIGDGLGVALSRLEQAKHAEGNQRQGAFVILMTDGSNNKGALAPLQAADIAKTRGIPVYTIGAGKDGIVRMPVFDTQGNKVGYRPYPSDLDEGTLTSIALKTDAKYFRADDIRTTENAFAAIDRTRKIEFQSKSYLLTAELFAWWAAPGAAALLLGALLARVSLSSHLRATAQSRQIQSKTT